MALFISPMPSEARVVVTEGSVYEIAETDMRELIQQRIQNFDVGTWRYKEQRRLAEKAQQFRPADAVLGLPASANGEPYNVDLTYILPYDIPDLNGNILYPKGFTYNPLELMAKKGLFFNKIIVVLNGQRASELAWFKTKFSDPRAAHLMVLLSDGYAFEVASQLNRPVQYLTEALKERFLIRETPSIIVQTPGSIYLTVKPYALDQNGKELKRGRQ